MKLREYSMIAAGALCAGGAVFSHPAFAKSDPISLTRQGKWVVNYGDDSCHLIGVFGTGSSEVALDIARYQPGDRFTLSLYSETLSSLDLEAKIKLAFGSDAPLPRDALTGTAGKFALVIVSGSMDVLNRPAPADDIPLPTITPEQEDAVSSLTYQFNGRKPVRLELGSMRATLKALRTCTTNLVKSWGLDPEVQAKLTKQATPVGSPGSWLRSSDYPADMIAQGKNGWVRFRLGVNEAGVVTDCTVQQKMNPVEFNTVSCKLLTKRARFDPALDASGKPVKSYFLGSVLWKIGL